jgi:hypothetical protein
MALRTFRSMPQPPDLRNTLANNAKNPAPYCRTAKLTVSVAAMRQWERLVLETSLETGHRGQRAGP